MRLRGLGSGVAVWLATSFLPILVVSIAVNVGLYSKSRELSGLLAVLRGEAKVQIAAGDTLPPLELASGAGTTAVVDLASIGKPTLLYVLSPTCVWCKRNSGSIRSVVEQVVGRVSVMILSIAKDNNDGLAAVTVPGLEVWFVSEASQRAYGLGATPQTILVGADGRLVKSWLGGFVGEVGRDVESTLKVQLPAAPESVAASQAAKGSLER